MATEGDRQSVFRTTKVRTALKGDSSWINRRQDPATGEDEKPWIDEVPSSDNTSNPPATNRAVSTKTDKTASTASNGYIGTSGYTRKPTDGYKQIAAHATRVNTESPEPPETTVSTEERDRRTEEASKVLNSSAGKQRSYVLSAAKKYDTPPDASASPATSFVAKRVVITDDEDSHLEQLKQSEEMSVDEPPKPKSKPDAITKPSYEPVVAATALAPVATLKKTTDSTSKASVTEPVAPAAPTVKDVPPSAPEATPKPSVKPKPAEKTSALNDDDLLGLTTSPSQKPSDPVPTADLLTGSALPKSKETKGSLDLLAIDVIPIDTSTDKLSPSKTSTRVETKTVVQTKTDVKSDKPVQKDSGLNDGDLLGLTQSPSQKPSDPVPTADLLTGSSLPKSKETKGSLDLLAIDVIPIDTSTDKLSPSKTSTRVETKTVVQTKTDVKSPVEMFDPLLSDSTSHRAVSVTFEQKSTDSKPWSKWAIPTVGTEEEEEEEEEEDTEEGSYTVSSRTEGVSNTPEPEPEPESDPDSRKNLVYVKSYVNSSSDLPRHSSWYDRASDQLDYVTSSSSSYAYSAPPSVGMTACTYCSKMVGDDSKITIEHLSISCHPECFKCGICSKPMGDFIDSMFLHRGTVHCESCYANVI